MSVTKQRMWIKEDGETTQDKKREEERGLCFISADSWMLLYAPVGGKILAKHPHGCIVADDHIFLAAIVTKSLFTKHFRVSNKFQKAGSAKEAICVYEWP